MKKNEEIIIFTPTSPFPPRGANQQDIYSRISLFRQSYKKITLCLYDHNSPSIENTIVDNVLKQKKLHRLFTQKEDAKTVLDYINTRNVTCWFEYTRLSSLGKLISKNCPHAKIFYRIHNFEILHFLEGIPLSSTKENLQSLWGNFKHLINILIDEYYMIKTSKEFFCISPEDHKLYEKLKIKKSNFLPFFFSKKIIRHTPCDQNKVLNLFFMGSDFRYKFNEIGIHYIVDKILPLLQKEQMNVKIYVLGKYPPSRYLNMKSKYLEFVGFVEDLDQFLEKMDAAIIPVNSGYGIKIKTLEALTRGFPTLGLPRAFRGINIRDSVHAEVFKDENDLRKKLNQLQNLEHRMVLGQNSFTFMKNLEPKQQFFKVIKSLTR